MSGSPKRKVIPSRVIRTGAMSQFSHDIVNGIFVEDADDDILLDPQACVCPSFSAKHRDSRPRRLDKVEGRWFQAEENSADRTAFDRPSKALVPAISLLSMKCSTC